MNLAQVMRDKSNTMQARQPEVMDYWNKLVASIARHADEGFTHLNHPFAGIVPASTILDSQVERELIKMLEKEGFTVIHHPNPDPGHPASRPYIEVHWR